MADVVRRVVTGIDANGKSCIVMDGPAPSSGRGGGAAVWEVDRIPTVGPHGPVVNPTPGLFCPKEGISVKQFVFEPDSILGMHRTETLDVVLVLSGEVWMLLEDEKDVLLKAGDYVIQRGTPHAWRNRSSQPCVCVGVLAAADITR